MMDTFRKYENGEDVFEELTDLAQLNGLDGVDDLVKKVEDGRISREKFEILKDGERPEAYRGGNAAMVASGEGSSRTQWFVDSGRTVYRQKGEALRDPRDELTATLNPFDALSRGLNNALNTGLMFNYQQKALNGWIKRANKFLDKPKDIQNSIRSQFMEEPVWAKETPQRIRDILESERNAIMRNINAETKGSRMWKATMDTIAESFDDVGFLKGAKAARWLRSKSPVSAVKGFAFHTKLGFFNPAQFPLQIQTGVTAAFVDPKHGVRAWESGLPTRLLLINRDDRVLDTVAKNTAKLHGMPVDEYKMMVKELRGSGFADVAKDRDWETN
jgi:hypothetical protein